MKITLNILLISILVNIITFSQNLDEFNKTTKLWEPYVDFTVVGLTNINPFDEIAFVTFTNTSTSRKIKTEMYYNLNDEWKFRFTGTEIGTWTFLSESSNPTLNGIVGSVLVKANDNPNAKGFVKNNIGKWATTDNLNDVFSPQFAMYSSPLHFYNNELQIEKDIQTFLIDHGFDGFHIPGSAYWFDLESISSTQIENIHGDNPNPDIRVFEALELLISKVHKIGKKVHIWLWGDQTDNWTPAKLRGGINGEVDKRLLRYISARLGPLPGWTMGYGFDNWRWVTSSEISIWHQYMHAHIDSSYSHLFGARGGGNSDKDINGYDQPSYEEQLNQLSESMDYSGYEQHKPSYSTYVATKNKRPNKPSFSEDRFRIRNKLHKDYNMNEVRKGLYYSAMAGGVANIWGVLLEESPDPTRNRSEFASEIFPNPEWIKTYSDFFQNRFLSNLVVDSLFSNGYGLKTPDNLHYITYKEDTEQIKLDLRNSHEPLPVVGVDTKQPYKEIHLGLLSQNEYTWHTPYISDWIVGVGSFDSSLTYFSRDSSIKLDSTLITNSNVFQIGSFTAIQEADSIIISFVTNSEVNIDNIMLERTDDLLSNWESIAQFDPQNFKNGNSSYTFRDTISLTSLSQYFRLNVTFNDGAQFISDTVSLKVRDSLSLNHFEIYSFTATSYKGRLNINLVTTHENNVESVEFNQFREQPFVWDLLFEFPAYNESNQTNQYFYSDTILTQDTEMFIQAKANFNDGTFLISDSIKVIFSDSSYSNNTDIVGFSAIQDFSDVHISLVTNNEENISKIKLQRLGAETIDWFTLKEFEPAESESSQNIYEFSDNIENSKEEYTYRAAIIYKDGASETTNIISITSSPNDIILLQNYPNPFNLSTVIEFSLPQDIITKLSIYNSLGQLIDVVYDELLEKGFHRVELNTKSLASGIYIYTLKSAYFFEQKKMILLK